MLLLPPLQAAEKEAHNRRRVSPVSNRTDNHLRRATLRTKGLDQVPASPPYIPKRNSLIVPWVDNFSDLLTAAPMTYGLLAADAAAVQAVRAPLDADWTLMSSPSTKTKQVVSDFNTALVTALAVIRPYAQTISLNQGVTSANKIAIGVNPRTTTPSPITPPATVPILTVQGLTGGLAYLRYRDSAASVSVKSKPYGVVAVQLAVIQATIAVPPTTPPSAWSIPVVATKSPLALPLAPYTPGSQVYVAPRYQLRNGQLSAWGATASFTVPQIS